MALHVCVRGVGIRRSKDLRAEIGKCPNSTNERKQMSTKTLRKRIALVAVTALGAGLLSVVAVPAANAGAVASETLGIIPNIAQADATLTSADEATAGAALNASVGLLTTAGSGTTQTAVLLSTGAITVVTGATSSVVNSITVENGQITKALHVTTNPVTAHVNSSRTATVAAVVGGTVDDNAPLGAIIKPNAGATTMIIRFFQGANVSTTTPTNGTLKGQVIVTIATASAADTYSASFSKINLALETSGTVSSTVDGVDQSGAGVIADGLRGYINVDLKDAYGNTLDGDGVLTAEASDGGLVAWNDGLGSVTTPSASITLDDNTSGTITVGRPAAMANKSFTTTVTIKWNGSVVGTKTIRFEGEVAKITASAPVIARSGATNEIAFRLKYEDDKGNALYPQSGTSVVSSTLTSKVSGASIGTYGVASTATLAKGTVVCSGSAGAASGAGSASLQMRHQNPLTGTLVTSNAWTQVCAGDAFTYTTSWDKASYTPGSVATLSITFKDALGNLANAYQPVSTTGSLISITGGPSATAVTAPANGDLADSAAGVKQYQFIVGTTLGDFAAVVSAPVVNANTVATNQTVSYKVASSSTAVTNEDVLKAIVSLIASINKQIAALQKALLRR
jgi:hypothetical protein